MQVMIWFLVYVLLIVALAVWRDHHDRGRARRRRRTNGARDGGADGRRRVTTNAVRHTLKQAHRSS